MISLTNRIKRVAVNLSDGKTVIVGVLMRARSNRLVLKDAEVSYSKGEWVSIDGQVEIPLASVSFVQVTQ